MFASFLPSLRMLVMLSVLTGVVYPLVTWGIAQLAFPAHGQRQPDRAGRQGRRIDADRPAVRRSEIFLEPAVGDFAATVQRRRIVRLEPGSAQSGAGRCGEGPRSRRCATRTRATMRRCPPISSRRRAAASIREISVAAAEYQVGARRQGARHAGRAVRALVAQHTEGRTFGILGEPGSMSSR